MQPDNKKQQQQQLLLLLQQQLPLPLLLQESCDPGRRSGAGKRPQCSVALTKNSSSSSGSNNKDSSSSKLGCVECMHWCGKPCSIAKCQISWLCRAMGSAGDGAEARKDARKQTRKRPEKDQKTAIFLIAGIVRCKWGGFG